MAMVANAPKFAENRQAEHKPNAGPPKDDLYVIWKQTVKNSSMWSFFYKKFTN